MAGRFCVELIESEQFLSLEKTNVLQISRDSDRATQRTVGARAAAYRVKPIQEPHFKFDRAAMAGARVFFPFCVHIASPRRKLSLLMPNIHNGLTPALHFIEKLAMR